MLHMNIKYVLSELMVDMQNNMSELMLYTTIDVLVQNDVTYDSVICPNLL